MDKKLIILGGVLSVLVLISAAYILRKGSGTSTASSSYNQNVGDTKIQANETSFNLGNMKVSDEKFHDFIIKNTGDKPLFLSNIKSSCMCTAGKIIYKSQESEEFGMHATGGSFEGIAPGDEVTIRVTYRPFQMPAYGPIEREVSMTTNDPSLPQLVFKVTAVVQ